MVSLFKVTFPDKPPIIIGTTRGFVSLANDLRILTDYPDSTYFIKLTWFGLLKYLITGK